MSPFTWYVLLPRHPLVRALAMVTGVLLLLALFAFGVIALAVLAVGGLLAMAWRSLAGPRRPRGSAGPPPPGIIEGEYTVIESRPPQQ